MKFIRPLAIVTAVLLSAPLARAADLDPYLPEDTESVLNINVRQILDSELVKKHFLDVAQEALRGNDQVQDILKDLGFDPFKDLDRVVVASPTSTEKDRGLVIVHGRFDVEKFKAKAEEVAKDESDHLKIHKILDGKLLYEVNHPEIDDPLFVAIASRDTLFVSPGKDYVIDALKKSGKENKPDLKNKKFQALLEKIDARQSLSLAAVTNPDLAKAIKKKAPGDISGLFEKIHALAGGLTISDEVKVELTVTTKNTQDAKEISDSAKAGLNLVLGFAAPIVQNGDNPVAEFVVDVIKSLSIKNKEEFVVVKGRVSSDIIEELFKKKSK